jgi:hypothetical protein
MLLSLTACNKNTDEVSKVETTDSVETSIEIDEKKNSLDEVTFQDIVVTQEDSDETIVLEAPLDLTASNVASELKEIKSAYKDLDIDGLLNSYAPTTEYYQSLKESIEELSDIYYRYDHIEAHLSVEDRLDTYLTNEKVKDLNDIYQMLYRNETYEYTEEYTNSYTAYCEEYASTHSEEDESEEYEDDFNPPEPTDDDIIYSFENEEDMQTSYDEMMESLTEIQSQIDDGSLKEFLIELEALNKENEHNEYDGVE